MSKQFPFDELCGLCKHLFGESCPFNGKVDALTRFKNIGCTRFESI